jgi:hypothetical protein
MKATSNACKWRIIGPSIGNSNQTKFVVNAETAQTNITINKHPEVIFPNNLNYNEIIFAPWPIISSAPKNIEIIISNIFTSKNTGKSIYLGKFPLSNGI